MTRIAYAVFILDGDVIIDGDLLLIRELLSFVRQNGIRDTEIFTELCAMPDKIPFYEQFGFFANEAQRLKQMVRAE